MASINKLQNWKPSAIFAVLSLAIMAPWFAPGYILTLDMVFTPELPMPSTVSSSYVFHAALHFLNVLVPSQIIQKALLFLIFFLSSLGMYRLATYIYAAPGRAASFGAYLAGIFYAVNPFTYDRLMAGQYSVLLGYALLPFFAKCFLVFLQKPALAVATKLAAWSVLISIISIHSLGLLAIFVLVASVTALCKHHAKPYTLRWFGFGLVSLGLFVVASCYWLVPLALGRGSTAVQISSFTDADIAAFDTLGNTIFEKLAHVAQLQGFWLEDRGMYTLPQQQTAGWAILAAMLLLVILVGTVQLWHTHRRMMLAILAASGVVGLLLASGIGTDWLAMHVPLFAGYREPQKFAGLLALSYSVCVAGGAAAIIHYVRREMGMQNAYVATVVLLLIPTLLTATIWWGARGQLTPRQYPAEWSVVNDQLNNDPSDFTTLVLPWHMYQYYDFAGRIISNPAPDFFGKPTIISNDPEFEGSHPPSSGDTQTAAIGRLLKHAYDRQDIGQQLAAHNIKYVLLTHDNDYHTYDYLSQRSDLQLVRKNASLELYRNEAWKEE